MKEFLIHIIWLIYIKPLWVIAVLICLLVGVWGGFGAVVIRKSERAWRVINAVFAFAAVFAVLFATVMNRDTLKSVAPDLIPFHFITQASYNKEAIRTVLMNVLLFVPFGLTVPFVVKKKPIAVTLSAAAVMSLLIEIVQFAFSLGQAETDDLISNTLGAAVGALAFVIVKQFLKKHNST